MIDASAFVIVLTTLPADGDVTTFARTLVDERLAACVNVLPAMESLYRWQGAVEQASERQVIMKTSAEKLADLNARIATLHPYDVPELLVLPIAGGGERYLKWVRESIAAEK